LERAEGEREFPDPSRDPVGYLCTWGSHPRWLVERWLARWSFAEVERLTEANNQRPELYIRPVGMTASDAQTRLQEVGVSASTVEGFPRSLRLPSGSELGTVLEAVPALVQDPAAALVVDYADVPAGATVLDLCSAPGGKTAGMAERAAFVAAADLSLARIERVRQNTERVGIADRVAMVVADGRVPPFRPVDVVLLDAPCTGTGTFRRHPDGRWRIGSTELESLVGLQRELLDAAAELVLLGGLLVSEACSREPEESEARVEQFIQGHPRFVRDPVPGGLDPAVITAEGDLQILPQRQGVAGAYAARLRSSD